MNKLTILKRPIDQIIISFCEIIAYAKYNTDHLLHHKVKATVAACQQRLISRRPFSVHAARLSNDNYAKAGAIESVAAHPLFGSPALSLDLCYHQCDRNDCCGTAHIGKTMKLWGTQGSAMCTCGHMTQSVQHVVVD